MARLSHDQLEQAIRRYGTTLEALAIAAQSQPQLSEMAKEARDHRLNGAFLVAGLDETTAKIFSVDDRKVHHILNPSFTCVGSGRAYAATRLYQRILPCGQ